MGIENLEFERGEVVKATTNAFLEVVAVVVLFFGVFLYIIYKLNN